MEKWLKPCLQCGGEAEILKEEAGYRIICKECRKLRAKERYLLQMGGSILFQDEESAIWDWNTNRSYKATRINSANLKDPGICNLVKLWFDLEELKDAANQEIVSTTYTGDELDEIEDRLVEAEKFLNFFLYNKESFEEEKIRDTWKDDISQLIDHMESLSFDIFLYMMVNREKITITQK